MPKLIAYEMTGDTSYNSKEITQEQAKDYPAPQWHTSETAIVWAEQRLVDGVLMDIPLPEPPQPYVPTLEETKASKVSQMKMQRDTLESSGFSYIGKTFDSDSKAIQRIAIAVQAVSFAVSQGQDLEFQWTCADNTVLTMTAQEFLGLPIALAGHANELHERYRQIKELIESCGTTEEVDAVTWDAI